MAHCRPQATDCGARAHHGISHPLTNSSSISASRAAASSAACRTRADAEVRIRVEQFEDAALAGVVAHLRDALDLAAVGQAEARYARRRAAAPPLPRAPPQCRLAATTRNASSCAWAWLARACATRPFRAAAIEQRQRGLHADDAADVAAADVRRLRARQHFRLGNAPPVGGAARQARGLEILLEREQLAARAARPARPAHRPAEASRAPAARSAATSVDGSVPGGKEAAPGAPARARDRPRPSRDRPRRRALRVRLAADRSRRRRPPLRAAPGCARALRAARADRVSSRSRTCAATSSA